jgi:hypothetical protein
MQCSAKERGERREERGERRGERGERRESGGPAMFHMNQVDEHARQLHVVRTVSVLDTHPGVPPPHHTNAE